MNIKFLPGECWYGACVRYGTNMPLCEDSEIVLDFSQNNTPNQSMPLLLSSKGRYLWRDSGFAASFCHGEIEVPGDVVLYDVPGTLRDAYLAAMKAHFPFHGAPARELFDGIIYNTWIELLFNQNQKDILHYAQGILDSGISAPETSSLSPEKASPNVLMIDDGWAESYGDWRFHSGKFPDAAGMLQTLHHMGFSVMVWVCPFVSADTCAYREARDKGLLIRHPDGNPYIVTWWNGCSAVLDLSNPEAVSWLSGQLDALLSLGVDGFKFDAGDSIYYPSDMVTWGQATPDEQSLLWAGFGEKYPLNEYRAAANAGGFSLLQRLCDKEHSWGIRGAASLIPDTLAQGITGYPYSCPDMIGGGEYLNFLDAAKGRLDGELFVRHCEIACLMPAVQFSAAPWRILDSTHFQAIKDSLSFRQKYLPYLLEQLENTAQTGEPVIRYMCYEFPDSGAEKITDQFMLGSRYLAAPVYEKGQHERKVFLPRGQWRYGEKTLEGQDDSVFFGSTPGIPILLERL